MVHKSHHMGIHCTLIPASVSREEGKEMSALLFSHNLHAETTMLDKVSRTAAVHPAGIEKSRIAFKWTEKHAWETLRPDYGTGRIHLQYANRKRDTHGVGFSGGADHVFDLCPFEADGGCGGTAAVVRAMEMRMLWKDPWRARERRETAGSKAGCSSGNGFAGLPWSGWSGAKPETIGYGLSECHCLA